MFHACGQRFDGMDEFFWGGEGPYKKLDVKRGNKKVTEPRKNRR